MFVSVSRAGGSGVARLQAREFAAENVTHDKIDPKCRRVNCRLLRQRSVRHRLQRPAKGHLPCLRFVPDSLPAPLVFFTSAEYAPCCSRGFWPGDTMANSCIGLKTPIALAWSRSLCEVWWRTLPGWAWTLTKVPPPRICSRQATRGTVPPDSRA